MVSNLVTCSLSLKSWLQGTVCGCALRARNSHAKGKGGTDVMSWRDFTLCSCPDLWEQWRSDSALDNSTQILLLTQDPGRNRTWRSLIYLPLCRHHSKRKYLMKLITLMVENWIRGYLIPGSWWSGHNHCQGCKACDDTFQALFQSAKHAPTYGVERVVTFYPAACCFCYYKLAAGYGNLWDQSRQAEKLRTQEMHCLDSGCIKSPRCRSLLSKTWRVFLVWPWCLGLFLVRCPAGKLGNCPRCPPFWRSWYGREIHREEGGKATYN